MKALIIAAVAGAALAASFGIALAQDVVPIRPNYRGEPSCPSNYVIRQGVCVSIYAGRGGQGGFEGGYRRERYRDSYDASPRRSRGDYEGGRREGFRPILRPDGLLQCPSNYVIRGGLCVSLY